ncbi:uncharacterized protein LOC135805044 [Sycon ciliatum]|uniref:uncharacterized protein LOC135805044 n=1 Tax=Sycon ciliatum TaxID=27933 RepID=UPI0020A8E5B8|eukprot:scpid98327/ scgid22195/ 
MAFCHGRMSVLGSCLMNRSWTATACVRQLSCTTTRCCAKAAPAASKPEANGEAPGTEHKSIGACKGTQYLKDQPDVPMYEDSYYPDWLFKLTLQRKTLLDLDPESQEFAYAIRRLKMCANNYRHKYKLDMFKRKHSVH